MVLDIILGIIVLLNLLRGWKRGFLYNAGLVLILIIAFVLASSSSALLADKLYTYSVDQAWLDNTSARVERELIHSTSIEDSLSELGLSKTYQKILHGQGEGVLSELGKSLDKVSQQSQAYLEDTSRAISHYLIRMTLQIVSFVVLLFGIYFVLRLILKYLSKGLNKLPLIGGVNRGLGLVLGFLLAVLICGTIISVLPGLTSEMPGFQTMLEESYIAQFLIESKLYQGILDTIF